MQVGLHLDRVQSPCYAVKAPGKRMGAFSKPKREGV
jgi:hypothetical protein